MIWPMAKSFGARKGKMCPPGARRLLPESESKLRYLWTAGITLARMILQPAKKFGSWTEAEIFLSRRRSSEMAWPILRADMGSGAQCEESASMRKETLHPK